MIASAPHRLFWALPALLLPAPALANAGVGYFMLGVPLVVAALLPAIVIEALIYQPMLRQDFRPALKLSTWANLASTFWGVVLGIGADLLLTAATDSSGLLPTRGAMLAALVPLLLLSWRIERRSVAKRLPEAPRARVEAATAVANLVTYALMALAVAFLAGSSGMSARSVVAIAILSAGPLRGEVTAHWRETRTFPVPRAPAAGYAGAPARVGIGEDGRVLIVINAPEHERIHGKTIEYRPRIVEADAAEPQLHWTCRAADIAPRDLPVSCR